MDFPVHPARRQRHLTHPGHGRRSAGGGWRGPALANEALQEEVEHKLQVPATSSQFVKDIQGHILGACRKIVNSLHLRLLLKSASHLGQKVWRLQQNHRLQCE